MWRRCPSWAATCMSTTTIMGVTDLAATPTVALQSCLGALGDEMDVWASVQVRVCGTIEVFGMGSRGRQFPLLRVSGGKYCRVYCYHHTPTCDPSQKQASCQPPRQQITHP